MFHDELKESVRQLFFVAVEPVLCVLRVYFIRIVNVQIEDSHEVDDRIFAI